MAVYTKVSCDQIKILLNKYEVGNFQSMSEIQEGVENSNFKIITDKDTCNDWVTYTVQYKHNVNYKQNDNDNDTDRHTQTHTYIDIHIHVYEYIYTNT